MVGAEGEAIRQQAFTGRLPSDGFIDATLDDIHRRYRGLDDGEVADYIPILAEADPEARSAEPTPESPPAEAGPELGDGGLR